MSSPSRQRLLRAVRLLPGAVRVGRGGIEEIDPAAAKKAAAVSLGDKEKPEESELVKARAEIKKLKSELRGVRSELSEEQLLSRTLNEELEKLKSDVELERVELHRKMELETAERRETAFNEGRTEGLEKGYGDGLAKAEAEIKAIYEDKFARALDLLAQIGDGLEASRENLAKAHASQLVRLWEMMLRRMLHAEVDLDSSTAERMLEAILKRVSDRERIIVYLNPSDVAMIEAGKERLIDSIRGVKVFEIMSDDHVDKGSCLVETNLGIYDARWRTQMEQVSGEVQSLLMESMASDEQAIEG